MNGDASGQRPLIVSLHDVAPPFEAEIRNQLELLAAAGITRVALKVVPNWKGRYPIAAAPGLLDLLRAQAEMGSEIILHGLEHRPHGPLRVPPVRRFIVTVLVRDTAEFFSLDESGAYEAVRTGRALLEDAGLPRATTFCAPGWFLHSQARNGVIRAGMSRIVNQHTLDDLGRGRRIRTTTVGYMGTPGLGETGVKAQNALMLRLLDRSPQPLKLYLHPQGGTHNPDMLRIVELASEMVRDGRRVMTFSELCGESGG